MRVGSDLRAGDPDRHVKVKQRGSVLNMLRRLDKIRFRGHRRDDFLDLAESPNASDTECGDEVPLKMPRASARDSEELRDTAGPGTLIMASGVQDFNRTEFDRLNEIKGHLEIALLEKHFLREYPWLGSRGRHPTDVQKGVGAGEALCQQSPGSLELGICGSCVTSPGEAPSAVPPRPARRPRSDRVFTVREGGRGAPC
ncbi:GRAM domain-containing protein 4-like isoform X2 [Mustela putorius furo]|uniref:GRAM domain-containing protein 4-like isoform X2 n=1 Tax=Mustela putorius furo TaxID=9669 RepID=A0A8U0V4E0_MUSPF|nr:GRAM domain-containing protein 4-like isoform X2 [Mustela putorius furo]